MMSQSKVNLIDLSESAEKTLQSMIPDNTNPSEFIEALVDAEYRRQELGVDARADLAGAVNTIISLQIETKKRVDALYDEATLTIADIAARQGVTVRALYGSPWKLPAFGVPDHGKSPKRWKLSSYEAWMEIPESERRASWDTMSVAERKKALA